MQDSLVAINIIDSTTNKLLNYKPVPMLYYWDGTEDIITSLEADNDFVKLIENQIDCTNYLSAKLSYFQFINDQYTENICNLQDIMQLHKFNSTSIIEFYLVKHFKYLYRQSVKRAYDYPDDMNNITQEFVIKDIYSILKEKYVNRVTKNTVINWVRSVLNTEDMFNNQNIETIINHLTVILQEYE